MNICPPDHKHGDTRTCHSLHRCRCAGCRRHNNEYTYWRKQMIRHGRGPVQSVDATGTRRRIEALMSLGWSSSYIADRIGSRTEKISLFRTNKTVSPSTAKKVAALYDEIWDQRPTPQTMPERVALTKTLAFAKARGFLPPLAWDDIDHDTAPPEPDEVDVIDEMAVAASIDGLKPKLTPAEKVEAIRILNRAGWSDPEIAPHMGIHRETVLRLRKQAGITAAPSIFRAA